MAYEAYTVFAPQTRFYRYSAAGCCIYCGSDGEADGLTDEHIIPEAIGGRLVIPRASCHACQRHTHAFEGRVIHRFYGDARAHMGMRRGKSRKWPATFKEKTLLESRIKISEVSLSEHPGIMLAVRLLPAGLFCSAPATQEHPRGKSIYAVMMNADYLKRLKLARQRLVLSDGQANLMDFELFLAKIAHAYACARFGVGLFLPYLAKVIRNGKPLLLSQYVGCQVSSYKPDGKIPLHNLAIGRVNVGSREFLFVHVQLFHPFNRVNAL